MDHGDAGYKDRVRYSVEKLGGLRQATKYTTRGNQGMQKQQLKQRGSTILYKQNIINLYRITIKVLIETFLVTIKNILKLLCCVINWF
jgi:hypothetical protein